MFVGCCDSGLHIYVCDIVFTCSNVIILKNASAYSYYMAIDKRQAAMGKRSCFLHVGNSRGIYIVL